jgi:hypothetical protein
VIKANEDGTFTITLRKPIAVCGEKVSEITFAEPTAKAYRVMARARDQAESMFAIVASVCGATPSAVEDMSLADFTDIVQAIGGAADPK